MQDHTASAGNPGYFVTMGEQETERLLALHQCYQQLHTHALESQAAPLVGKTSGEQILDVACGTGGVGARRCAVATRKQGDRH